MSEGAVERVEVLRLRNRFALRSSCSAQDDSIWLGEDRAAAGRMHGSFVREPVAEELPAFWRLAQDDRSTRFGLIERSGEIGAPEIPPFARSREGWGSLGDLVTGSQDDSIWLGEDRAAAGRMHRSFVREPVAEELPAFWRLAQDDRSTRFGLIERSGEIGAPEIPPFARSREGWGSLGDLVTGSQDDSIWLGEDRVAAGRMHGSFVREPVAEELPAFWRLAQDDKSPGRGGKGLLAQCASLKCQPYRRWVMGSYPAEIRRCQHIKTNGTQCGSPALRSGRLCHYHRESQPERVEVCGENGQACGNILVPVFEDASAIQTMVRQVTILLLQGKIDSKRAGQVLYAMQIASANLKRMELEKPRPVQVVVDEEKVAETPLGMTPWSRKEGRT